MHHITAPELANRLADPLQTKPLLLDVREAWEFETCHIPDAVLMAMQTVPARMQELDEEQEIICICHHGA
ncbi:MAG: sulfurtransferase, partial [Burkholderiaceae bacterium]|nr:sulfurtransferase [Burkholderiaceae bacterium]